MTCLICGRSQHQSISLNDLLFGKKLKTKVCCQTCKGKFVTIDIESSKRCKYCLKHSERDVCHDCLYWQSNNMLVETHQALFEYNEAMSEYMSDYKFKGRKELAKVFSEELHSEIKKISHDRLIPMPLSKKRLKDRGFHQIELLLNEAGISYDSLLKKKQHTRKQSSKSKRERLKATHHFYVPTKDAKKIKGQVILLVDDVYTTGSTMLHAKRYLLALGAKKVITFTLSR